MGCGGSVPTAGASVAPSQQPGAVNGDNAATAARRARIGGSSSTSDTRQQQETKTLPLGDVNRRTADAQQLEQQQQQQQQDQTVVPASTNGSVHRHGSASSLPDRLLATLATSKSQAEQRKAHHTAVIAALSAGSPLASLSAPALPGQSPSASGSTNDDYLKQQSSIVSVPAAGHGPDAVSDNAVEIPPEPHQQQLTATVTDKTTRSKLVGMGRYKGSEVRFDSNLSRSEFPPHFNDEPRRGVASHRGHYARSIQITALSSDGMYFLSFWLVGISSTGSVYGLYSRQAPTVDKTPHITLDYGSLEGEHLTEGSDARIVAEISNYSWDILTNTLSVSGTLTARWTDSNLRLAFVWYLQDPQLRHENELRRAHSYDNLIAEGEIGEYPLHDLAAPVIDATTNSRFVARGSFQGVVVNFDSSLEDLAFRTRAEPSRFFGPCPSQGPKHKSFTMVALSEDRQFKIRLQFFQIRGRCHAVSASSSERAKIPNLPYFVLEFGPVHAPRSERLSTTDQPSVFAELTRVSIEKRGSTVPNGITVGGNVRALWSDSYVQIAFTSSGDLST